MTRFGIHLVMGPDQGFAHLAGLALAAEEAGFDEVWVSDRSADASPDRPETSEGPEGTVGSDGGIEPAAPAAGPGPEATLEATTLLGALATRTSRIRLGALVTDLSARNPAVLAKTVTTLDVITGGRIVLGFWPAPDHEDGSPGVLDESVRICRAMFSGDDVSLAGPHFSVQHARNLPRPVQAGGPRILVGSLLDDDSLSLVARHADQCGASGDASTVADTVAGLRRLCHRIGRDPDEIDIVWFAPCVLLDTGSHPSTEVPRGTEEAKLAGTLMAAPDLIPALIAGHLAAGADEVVFGFASVQPDDITALGRALGLGGAGRPVPPGSGR